MSSMLGQIADAVVTRLNGGAYSAAFTAVRRNLAERDIATVSALTVLVVPKARQSAIATREECAETYTVDIAIAKRVTDPESAAEMEPLLALAEEIEARLRLDVLPTTPPAAWAGSEFPLAYEQGFLRDKRTFLSVLTVQYEVVR